METLKYGVWVLWIGSGAMFCFGDEELAMVGKFIFVGTLLAHLAEYFVKRSLFQKLGGDGSHHFIQTMIYGLFYWKPLEDKLRKG